jgi:hypothetical protein
MLGIVAKPYEIEQLSDAIAQALQASSTRPRSTTA